MEPDDAFNRSESGTRLPYLMASPKSISHASISAPKTKVTATSKLFQYTRMQDNQIRVLRMSNDPDTKHLICSFEVRDFTACRGTYKAISYCWGDPRPTYSVLCSTGGYLDITESAAEILKFVLSRNPDDWFWIDQICINQSDLAERSAQVSMMGQVYSSASQVIAWLGRGDKNTQRAVDFVEQMSTSLKDMKSKGIQPTLESYFKKPVRFHNVFGILYESRKWRALTDLLANPWFERLWVVQEVVMAPDEISRTVCREDPIILSFENCTINFEMFATVVQTIWDDHLHTELDYSHNSKDTTDQLRQYPPGFNAVRIYLLFRKIRREKTESLSMSWGLIYTKNFKASDYRDKIYAVMNFVDRANLRLQFDYNLSVEEVYITSATELIEIEDYPILLHIAGIGLRDCPSTLPSWVPDFSPGPFGVWVKSHITEKWFEASANPTTNTIRLDHHSKTMSFMGVEIDRVELLFRRPSPDDPGKRGLSQETSSRRSALFKAAQGVVYPERDYYESFLKVLNDVEAFLNSSRTNSNSRGPASKETLLYTLIKDYPIGNATVDSDILEAFDAWYSAHQELAGQRIVRSFFASATRDTETYDQIQTFEDLLGPPNEPIFGTATRRLLGSGPSGMLPGDVVCIIMGACTPFLIRPDMESTGDQRSKRWKLVGPCFVYGLMYGEGLNMGDPKEFIVT